MHRLTQGKGVGAGFTEKDGSTEEESKSHSFSNSSIPYGPDAMFGSESETSNTNVVRLGSMRGSIKGS